MSQLCKSVQYAYRSKSLLRLNMHPQRSISKKVTKNYPLRFVFSTPPPWFAFHLPKLNESTRFSVKRVEKQKVTCFTENSLIYTRFQCYVHRRQIRSSFDMLCNLAHIKMITQLTLLRSNSTFRQRRWIYLTSN